MTPEQQICLVKSLCDAVALECAEKIAKGNVPPNWDGNELRAWLRDRFDLVGRLSLITREPRSKRAKDYRNTVIINNL